MSRVFLGVVVIVAAMTSGCVVYVSDEGDGYNIRRSDVARQEERNRDVIAQLKLGTTLEQVRLQLGDPDFSEAWASGHDEIRVLRYRTHRTKADGDTTIDETTPLVFRAGQLVGIGERAVDEPVSGHSDSTGAAPAGFAWRYL